MVPLSLPAGPLSLLCLGAHADDIEIGCGGSILHLLAEHPGSLCTWVVLSAEGLRADEARRSAGLFLQGTAEPLLHIHTFRDGYFPSLLGEIKDVFEALKKTVAPDTVFTHCRDDRHQDHRAVSDLTWQTFRNHSIFEYEVPKYDADLGAPNVFIALPETVRRRKVAHLMAAFHTQHSKRWFTEDTFEALMRLRGIECAAPEGYAEAFYARKVVLGS